MSAPMLWCLVGATVALVARSLLYRDRDEQARVEDQRSAQQTEEQRQYVALLYRTAEQARERIRMLWESAETNATKQAYYLARWHATYRSYCESRWAEAKRPRIQPIPIRREASGR